MQDQSIIEYRSICLYITVLYSAQDGRITTWREYLQCGNANHSCISYSLYYYYNNDHGLRYLSVLFSSFPFPFVKGNEILRQKKGSRRSSQIFSRDVGRRTHSRCKYFQYNTQVPPFSRLILFYTHSKWNWRPCINHLFLYHYFFIISI